MALLFFFLIDCSITGGAEASGSRCASNDVHAPVRTTRARIDKRIDRPSADCVFLRPLDSLLSFTEAKENVLGSVRDLTWFGIIPLYYLVDDPKEKKVITATNSVLLLVKRPRNT